MECDRDITKGDPMATSTNLISGLSSGFDWRSMIDQLIAIEHRRVESVELEVRDGCAVIEHAHPRPGETAEPDPGQRIARPLRPRARRAG